MTENEIWHGDNNNLNIATDKNRRDLNGDMKGKPLRYEVRSRIMRLLEEKVPDKNGKMRNMNHDEIAKMMGVCKKTVSNYKKAKKDQNLEQIHDPVAGILTVGVPAPGKQGGFRWSRMNQEQQETCVQIAVENPRDTIAQTRMKLQEKYPDLNVADSTVWRTLKSAGITYMRAKLKDPLGEGELASEAKNKELEAFIKEQYAGEDGMLNPHNLFFMDETLITLNEVAKRGWGSKDDIPEIAKSKGKTLTLNLYVGLGLVSESLTEDTFKINIEDPGCIIGNTEPRGNHIKYDPIDKCWNRADEPPKFALFWWIRPPTRPSTALSRFLNVDDILDPNFTLFDPTQLKNDLDKCKPKLAVKPKELLNFRISKSKTKPQRARNQSEIEEEVGNKTGLVDNIKEKFFEFIQTNNNPQTFSYDHSTQTTISGKFIKCKYLNEQYYLIIENDFKPEQSIEDCGFFAAKAAAAQKEAAANAANAAAAAKAELDALRDVGGDSDAITAATAKVAAADAAASAVKVEQNKLDNFLKPLDPEYTNDYFTMQKLLWLNGIEHRQVDKDDGSLIRVIEDGRKTSQINLNLESMVRLYEEFQILVKNALGKENSVVSKVIPRAYYTATGRSTLGGKIDSERGDRALFLKYLVETVNYYNKVFPDEVVDNLRLAWDSAPQHGKIDVDSKHYSYIHQWTTKNLGVPSIFLPVKAPDYNPAENLIGYIKGQIRLKQRSFTGEATVQKMTELIDSAMGTVTKNMIEGWVRYGCYNIPEDNTPLDQKRCIDPLLEVKDPVNFLDMSLEIWKNKTLEQNQYLKNTEFFMNDHFKHQILYDDTDTSEFENVLIRYKTKEQLEKDFIFVKDLKPDNKKFSINEPLKFTTNIFNFTKEAENIREINEKNSILTITKMDGSVNTYYITKSTSSLEKHELVENNNKYELTNPSSTFLGAKTIIKYSNLFFQNEATVVIDNFKIPAYKELFNIVKMCKEEYNFPCLANILKNLLEESKVANKEEILNLVSYVSSYIIQSRGPLSILNSKACKNFVDEIKNYIFKEPYEPGIEENDIKHILGGFDPLITKRDVIQYKIDDNSKMQLSKINNIQYNTTLKIFENVPGTADEKKVEVTKAKSSYFEVEGSMRIENPQKFKKPENLTELKNKRDKAKELLMKTPFSSSIPDDKNSETIKYLGIAFVITKAIQHEKKILVEVNNHIGKLIEPEISKPNEINWSKIVKILNEAVLKLKRTCKDCEKSKYKRFPKFDIISELEKHHQENKMKRKALSRKKEGDRRWPGYPDKDPETRRKEGYEERGTGPGFDVILNNNTKERKIDNYFHEIYADENDEDKVYIKVDKDKDFEELNRLEDPEKWEKYFGPFSQENNHKLTLARQRVEENKEKQKKVNLIKNLQTDQIKGFDKRILLPNGKKVTLTKEKKPLVDYLFYDAINKRFYPPLNFSYKDVKDLSKEEKEKVLNQTQIVYLANTSHILDSKKHDYTIPYSDCKDMLNTSDMFRPVPLKYLGIDLKRYNLSNEKKRYYYVKQQDMEKFFSNFVHNQVDTENEIPSLGIKFLLNTDKSLPFIQKGDEIFYLIKKTEFEKAHNNMKLRKNDGTIADADNKGILLEAFWIPHYAEINDTNKNTRTEFAIDIQKQKFDAF